MSKPICRVGDLAHGICTQHNSPVSWTGRWVTGDSTVLTNGRPTIRLGDIGLTGCGHTFRAITSSNTGFASGKGIHRQGDKVIVVGGGQGTSITGSSDCLCG